ncbi:MAG: aspartate aminotransferase family protein [Candidatus Diapherotrites archaeon]
MHNGIEEKFDIGIVPKRPLEIVSGKGSKLYDTQGREFLDFGASYSVCALGHGNERVLQAIREQSERLVYTYNFLFNPARAALLERLDSITPPRLKKTFLCNSGTESVEAALKFARAFTGKKKIIAANRAFHGKTMGALSATYKQEYKKPFEPLLAGFGHVQFSNAEALESAMDNETAAFIVEPIQGEAGVILPDKDYLKQAREICDRHNALLIIDEVQSGMCRTGKMFAFEHYSVEPDILCLAKALASGIPIGATIVTEEIASSIPKLSHSSTFGGNPLACAAASATIDEMLEKKLAERSADSGEYFMEKLKGISSPRVREVRGKGLMVAVELKERVTPFLMKLMDEGVLAIAAGQTTMRLYPPLTVSKQEIDSCVEKLGKVLLHEP